MYADANVTIYHLIDTEAIWTDHHVSTFVHVISSAARLASVHYMYIITFIIIFNYEKKTSYKNSILSDCQI